MDNPIDVTQIKRLQAIQNALARAVTKTSKHHHITPILKVLDWLKITKRIEYKVKVSLTYIYSTDHSSQPSYLRQIVSIQPPQFHPFLLHPSTDPPFCHLITNIWQSLHSHSCFPLFGRNSLSVATNIWLILRTHANLTFCDLSTALSLQSENTAF